MRARRATLSLVIAGSIATLIVSCTSFDQAVADGGYFDVADATRVCARLFSCPGLAASLRQSIAAPVDDTNFSLCLSWLAGPAPTPPSGFSAQVEALRRVGAAASCDAAASGLEARVLAPDDTRCDGAADACLDATHVLDCHERRILDCAGGGFAPGSACALTGNIARCAVGPCSLPGENILACADGALTICDRSLKQKYAIVCAATGASCVTSPTRVSVTATASISISACTSSDNELTLAAVCSGAVGDGVTACSTDSAAMVVCNRLVNFKSKGGLTTVGGVESLYHCQKDLGWSCIEGAAGAIAACARPGAECAITDADVNRCDGSAIEVCLAGRRARVDCATAGATCRGEGGGEGGGARCVVAE